MNTQQNSGHDDAVVSLPSAGKLHTCPESNIPSPRQYDRDTPSAFAGDGTKKPDARQRSCDFQNFCAASGSNVRGEVHDHNDTHITADLAPLILEIQSHCFGLRNLIDTRIMNVNRLKANARIIMGFVGLEKDSPEGSKVKQEASDLIDAMLNGGTIRDEWQKAAQQLSEIVVPVGIMLESLKRKQGSLERQIKKLVRQLPISNWLDSKECDGFGELSCGRIIAECGDLNKYSNPAKVWKRMGLAVSKDGKAYSTHRRQKMPPPEGWENAGYCPRRRSVMYLVSQSVNKRINSPLRKLIDDRKAYLAEKHPDQTKMHIQNQAFRYMEKRVLLNLWKEWRKATMASGATHSL